MLHKNNKIVFIISCRFEMNCTLLNDNTKVIQKNKKQLLNTESTNTQCKINFSSKPGVDSPLQLTDQFFQKKLL